MNKSELIDAVAAATADVAQRRRRSCGRWSARRITAALKKGDSVSLVGFGTFAVERREARTGRNPQTGELQSRLPLVTSPAFKAGKA